jgi:DNA polymerase-3 subunit epsilon
VSSLRTPNCLLGFGNNRADITKDRIVELAAVKLRPDGTEIAFHKQLNPGIRIPDAATEIHGISNADVRNKPTFSQVAKDLVRHLKGCDIAGFNITRFDVPLLQAEFSRASIFWPEGDVYLVDCQVVYHQKEPRDLAAAVAFYCGRKQQKAHSALADARAAKAVLEGQIRRYSDLPNDVEGLDRFCDDVRPSRFADSGCWFFRENEALIFAKGRNKGSTLAEVADTDPGYLEWMLGIDTPEDTKALLTGALDSSG